MTQLVLSLKTPGKFTLETIVTHEGIDTPLRMIRSVFGAQTGPMPSLFLYGPGGTGKTHLLKASASLIQERGQASTELVEYIRPRGTRPSFARLIEIVSLPDDSFARVGGAAIDDVHLMGEYDSLNLWNLFNRLTARGRPILMTSRRAPKDTFLGDPHLTSRVLSGLVFHLSPPGDRARLQIMDKLGRDRNLRLSPDVSRYLVTRTSRNIKELETIIDILDTTSLELKRRITVPLVKLLEEQGVI